MEKNKLETMVVLITGVSSGIGYQLFRQFSQMQNTKVIGISRNKEKLKELDDDCLNNNSTNHYLIESDITNKGYQNQLSEILLKYGKLDILINNAGALVNKPFEEVTSEDLLVCYKTNVFAPYHLIQYSLPWLRKSSIAHVVNIGSMGGVQGSSKFPGLSAYSSSKGALITLTECLAEELKEFNVKVNCVNLGAVQTEMLQKAFPSFNAKHSPQETAKWLITFALNSHLLMNGKSIQLSDSTP